MQGGVIDNRTAWRATNIGAAAWWGGVGVTAGAVSLGFAAPLAGMSFATVAGAGVISGGLVAGFGMMELGRSTDGFLNVSGRDIRNLTVRSFVGAAAGAAAKMFSPLSLITGGEFAQMFVSNGLAFGSAYLAGSAIQGRPPTAEGLVAAILGGIASKPAYFAVNIVLVLHRILQQILEEVMT